jgi:hypothetical protein
MMSAHDLALFGLPFPNGVRNARYACPWRVRPFPEGAGRFHGRLVTVKRSIFASIPKAAEPGPFRPRAKIAAPLCPKAHFAKIEPAHLVKTVAAPQLSRLAADGWDKPL